MCKAKHYTEQLINIYDNINKDIEHCNAEISRLSLLEQDLLHIIENSNFNVAQGYKLAKRIKDAREERRIIKNEFYTLDNLKRSFIDRNINYLKDVHTRIIKQDNNLIKVTENKSYHPRILESTDLKVVVPLNRKVI